MPAAGHGSTLLLGCKKQGRERDNVVHKNGQFGRYYRICKKVDHHLIQSRGHQGFVRQKKNARKAWVQEERKRPPNSHHSGLFIRRRKGCERGTTG